MLGFALLLAMSEPEWVAVGKCWSHESYTLTEIDPDHREFVWEGDGKKLSLSETGAGTGVPVRVLVSGDAEFMEQISYEGDDIILGDDRYELGCE